MRFDSNKRPASDADVELWLDAADKQTGPLSDQQLIDYLKAKNSYRWWRLNYDARWAKKTLKKIGVSPERIRRLIE